MTANDTRGFSLIEVLVVIVIIGVLAGIAISQYASYQADSADSKVVSAVRQVATGEEAYYTTALAYTSDPADLDGIMVDDVVLEVRAGNSGDLETSFRIVASHPEATHSFVWTSDPAPGEPQLMKL